MELTNELLNVMYSLSMYGFKTIVVPEIGKIYQIVSFNPAASSIKKHILSGRDITKHLVSDGKFRSLEGITAESVSSFANDLQRNVAVVNIEFHEAYKYIIIG